jgi:Peptidase family S41
MLKLVEQSKPDKLVIDLRQNSGGDYNEGLKYLVHPIRDLAAIDKKGHLFVLVGANTFSAAMSNATQFRYQTEAILVGRAIGEKPNSYQEPRSFNNMRVSYKGAQPSAGKQGEQCSGELNARTT